MEPQITLDPALTSGVDEGIGRRGVDWNYVQQAVAQHHQTEQDANRRRGQDTFNRLIGQNVPYADALRQAANDGLYFDNAAGRIQAEQHIADQKQKEANNPRKFIHDPKGIWITDPKTGTITQLADFGDTGNTQKAQTSILGNLDKIIKENTDAKDSDVYKKAVAQRQGIMENIAGKIPGMAVTTNVVPAVPSNMIGWGGKPAQTNYAPARVSAPAQIPESPIVAPAQSSSTISTKAQFDALEPGAIYIGKDGKRRRKP